ncbi:MAG: protein phosphatase 2C domain-containing protein [Deltaproteobacteria bacterium]|nr:protein phosphatase 2C domain-containing protein [Deltaproteobacteria bacterium]
MLRLFENGNRDNLLLPAAITDTGYERDLNEDRYCVLETKLGIFWAVLDGLGGVSGGEVAAQIAMDAFLREVANCTEKDDPEEVLIKAIREANRIIILRRQNPNFAGMGTTLVAALITPNRLYIANVGDSRAYLIKDDDITQLTVDHTLVQQYVDMGKLLASEALSHPESHVLTKCLGSDHRLTPDLFSFGIYQNSGYDTLVLCTDGLYSMLTEKELADIVRSHSPQTAVVKLVELVKNRGGFDNITVAVIPIPGRVSLEDSVMKLSDRRSKFINLSPIFWIAVFIGVLLLVMAIMVALLVLN